MLGRCGLNHQITMALPDILQHHDKFDSLADSSIEILTLQPAQIQGYRIEKLICMISQDLVFFK